MSHLQQSHGVPILRGDFTCRRCTREKSRARPPSSGRPSPTTSASNTSTALPPTRFGMRARKRPTRQFVAGSFAVSDFRTTKYLIQVQETGSSNFYSTEVFIMHDDSEVYMTQYGTLNTDSSPVTSIEADIDSGNVRLLITPSVSNTTTKISRISLTA